MEQKTNGKVAFAYLNSRGECKNTLILNHFSMRNNKTPEQHKLDYEEDKNLIRKFLEKNHPGVIVLGATSSDALHIKYRLDEIVTEVFEGEGVKDE